MQKGRKDFVEGWLGIGYILIAVVFFGIMSVVSMLEKKERRRNG